MWWYVLQIGVAVAVFVWWVEFRPSDLPANPYIPGILMILGAALATAIVSWALALGRWIRRLLSRQSALSVSSGEERSRPRIGQEPRKP